MSVATYTKSGTKSTTAVNLDKKIFGVEVKNHDGLKKSYEAYLSNGRVGSASVKTRGEIRGGGRKPWRQKGTGRARFGSIRNPIWRGGGIVFGPTGLENYTKKINMKAKKHALKQALSLKADSNSIIVLEEFVNKDGKVKDTIALLNKIGANKNILLVTEVKDALIDRSTSNVPNLKVVLPSYLNVYDVINADSIVITKKSLEVISAWLEGAK